MRAWDLTEVERAFAEAAVNSKKWNQAMDVAAAIVGARGAVLLPVTGAQMPEVPESQTVGEANEAYFRQRWYEQDERSKGIPLLMRKGVVDDLDLFRSDYIKRNAYYQ